MHRQQQHRRLRGPHQFDWIINILGQTHYVYAVDAVRHHAGAEQLIVINDKNLRAPRCACSQW